MNMVSFEKSLNFQNKTDVPNHCRIPAMMNFHSKAYRRFVFLLLGAVLVLFRCPGIQSEGIAAAGAPEQVRKPAIAGTWYPASPVELRKQIEGFLNRVPESKPRGQLVALISPHAGYVYSGQVAAYGYKLLEKQKFASVIVISPSHRARFEGVATYELGGFQTPLGIVPLDRDLIEALRRRDKHIVHRPEVHSEEHALEIQLPFLQTVLGEFKLVPLIMGEQDFATCKRLAEAIAETIREKRVLVIASSDLSHFHPYERARALDKVVADRVGALDPQGLSYSLAGGECEACGGGPMVTAMLAAMRLGANSAEVLKVANSGDVTGNKNDARGVVGYMSAALWRGPSGKAGAAGTFDLIAKAEAAGLPESNAAGFNLTAEEKEALHRIAKQAIEARLRGGPAPSVDKASGNLKEPRGAFVTLHKRGELRGCIGHIITSRPLIETVSEVAVAAAVQDPRFRPVTAEEFKDLDIEISVLTPLRKITGVEEVEVGKHGLVIRRNGASGLLLPQVATQYGWDRRAFLENTCRKAGLPSNAWQDERTEIYVFSAEVF